MKNYDNLVGLIMSVLVTAYLIYALIAPEKL
jgi:K+-transporting ATPase KdpF subunit